AVLQHAGRRLVGGRDPDLANDREPGRDHRSESSQPFDAGGRIAEKRLTREINPRRHRSSPKHQPFLCGEPYKLRSNLSEDSGLPRARTGGKISGQTCELKALCRGLVRGHGHPTLPKVTICAIAPRNHSCGRASRAISDRDRACNGAQADRPSAVRPSSLATQTLWPSIPLGLRGQARPPHSRAVGSSEFFPSAAGFMTGRQDVLAGDLPVLAYVFEREAGAAI